MDTGALFLILAVVLMVGFYVARPFMDRSASAVSAADQERSSLLAERERVLDALQELDFDYRLGKIPEEDYPGQRSLLVQRGAAVLERLDALEAIRKPVSDAVEKAIADRRANANAGPRQPVAADDEVERMIAARRREQSSKPTGFCPHCGQAVHQTDKFCSKCGNPLD